MALPYSPILRNALVGALFGASFPLGAMAVLLWRQGLDTGVIQAVAALHAQHPLLAIIDTAPFFLGLFAAIAGWQEARLKRLSQRLEEEVADKTESLATALEEARRSNERMTRLAYFDSLTGLGNRRLAQERLDQGAPKAERAGRRMAVFLVDIHRFKRINESLGREVGDQLLCAVADDLQALAPADATVVRTEGNRFALLEPVARETEPLRQRAETLIAHLSRTFALEGYALPVNAHLGISVFPDDGRDAERLLDNAENALFRAKEEGANRFLFFTPEMNKSALERLGLESDLNRALDRGEFELVYQPQVSLSDGCTVGMEALLRWHHPQRGPVSPAEFVPLLEDLGLIIPVGEWVLRTAARQLRQWRGMGHPDLVMAVNLSPGQFRDKELVAKVEAVLAETALPPDALHLEITENLFLEDIPGVDEVLRRLDRMGVGLVLDDFGTGYSALSYLQNFPLQVLKIDRSFVHQLTDNPRSANLVRGAVELGAALGMETVAEGVETQAQVDFLREVDCPVAQGFGFSPPLTVAGAEDLLSGRQGFAVTLRPVEPMAVISHHLIQRGGLQNDAGRDGNLARALVDSLPGVYYLIGADGELLWWNRFLEEVTGYGPGEIAAMGYEEFFTGRDRDRVAEAFRTVLQEGQATLDAQLVGRSGETLPYFFHSTRLSAGGNEFVTGLGLDISHQRRLEDQLRLLATTDRLTGIANRFRCEEQLEIEMGKVRRYSRSFSLVLFDIDRFAEINDMAGHDVGDQVLQQLIELVRHRLREVDLLARWGEDEFAILAPETELDGARALAGKLRRAIGDHRFDSVGDLAVSFGLGCYRPEESRHGFLKRVDDALYAAKKGGGNRMETAPEG